MALQSIRARAASTTMFLTLVAVMSRVSAHGALGASPQLRDLLTYGVAASPAPTWGALAGTTGASPVQKPPERTSTVPLGQDVGLLSPTVRPLSQ